MMMSVMSGPPEDSLLRRGHGHEGQDELKQAAGLEGAMRKIAVVAGSHPEHAHGDKRDTGDQIRPAKWNEENTYRSKVNQSKGRRTNERDSRAIWQRYREQSRSRSHPAVPPVQISRPALTLPLAQK